MQSYSAQREVQVPCARVIKGVCCVMSASKGGLGGEADYKEAIRTCGCWERQRSLLVGHV
jgi:hypothetical protein